MTVSTWSASIWGCSIVILPESLRGRAGDTRWWWRKYSSLHYLHQVENKGTKTPLKVATMTDIWETQMVTKCPQQWQAGTFLISSHDDHNQCDFLWKPFSYCGIFMPTCLSNWHNISTKMMFLGDWAPLEIAWLKKKVTNSNKLALSCFYLRPSLR